MVTSGRVINGFDHLNICLSDTTNRWQPAYCSQPDEVVTATVASPKHEGAVCPALRFILSVLTTRGPGGSENGDSK